MKKRLLAICLALCLIVGLLPTAVLAAPEGDGDGLTAENPMSVPVDRMVIKNGTYEIASALGTTLDLENGGSSWGTNILTMEKNNCEMK